MGTSVSILLRTAIGDQVSQGAVSKITKDATVQMVVQTKVLSIISGGLTMSDELMWYIAKLVIRAVKQKTRKVEYVKKG